MGRVAEVEELSPVAVAHWESIDIVNLADSQSIATGVAQHTARWDVAEVEVVVRAEHRQIDFRTK